MNAALVLTPASACPRHIGRPNVTYPLARVTYPPPRTARLHPKSLRSKGIGAPRDGITDWIPHHDGQYACEWTPSKVTYRRVGRLTSASRQKAAAKERDESDSSHNRSGTHCRSGGSVLCGRQLESVRSVAGPWESRFACGSLPRRTVAIRIRPVSVSALLRSFREASASKRAAQLAVAPDQNRCFTVLQDPAFTPSRFGPVNCRTLGDSAEMQADGNLDP